MLSVDNIIGDVFLRLDIQLQAGDEGTLFCGVEVGLCRFNQRIQIRFSALKLHEKFRLQIVGLWPLPPFLPASWVFCLGASFPSILHLFCRS